MLIGGLIAVAWLDWQFPQVWIGSTRIGPGVVALAVVALLIGPIIAGEYAGLCELCGIRSPKWLQFSGIVAGIASVAVLGSVADPFTARHIAMSVPVVLVVLAAIELARRKEPRGAIATIGSVLLAYAWIGVPLGFWVILRRDRDALTMAGAILCVKSADIGAYFTGITLGRHKLIPWLSPGKSWEGLLGGVAFSGAVGCGLAHCSSTPAAADLFVEPISLGYGAIVGAVIGLVGVAGDLFESLLKRCAGAKDSGSCLPGMGGLFDVLDSLLPAGPVAWWLLTR